MTLHHSLAWFCHWHYYMGPGILPETTVGKHNPPCHLQIPTKALSCKKEAICEHGPEAPLCPVGQGSFKMECFKVEKCSMVRRIQIWHSCWKSWTPCPPGYIYIYAFSRRFYPKRLTLHSSYSFYILSALSGLKRRETFQRVISIQFKNQHLWWYGGA